MEYFNYYSMRYPPANFCVCVSRGFQISNLKKFYVAVRLLSNRSQLLPKCGKNKNVSLMFLAHLDAFCGLLLYRPAGTWNLFVLKSKRLLMATSFIRPSSNRSQVRTNQIACIIQPSTKPLTLWTPSVTDF